ncbi:MAG: hypothetical protein KDD38_04115 [Bdellovibrionales bacterium]|nr:hypothetical protein [Bdellovibrionales bacterium]
MAKLLAAAVLFLSLSSHAQILVEDPEGGAVEAPRVGRGAATDYFKKREAVREEREDRPVRYDSERILMLDVGTFVNDKAYRWGSQKKINDPGRAMLGVTYRMGEWRNSMDLYIRAELMTYRVDDMTPVKLSLMPIIAFPDVRSEFPLYFGAGIGAGVFFKQVGDESDLSLDYALIIGARFADVFSSGTGLFLETGLKGQVHLLSSGQQDGVYVSTGAIFSF